MQQEKAADATEIMPEVLSTSEAHSAQVAVPTQTTDAPGHARTIETRITEPAAPAVQPKSFASLRTLRHGTFRVDKSKLVNFVLVPDGYRPEKGTIVSEVLSALGVAEPDLAFLFHKGKDVPCTATLPCTTTQDVLATVESDAKTPHFNASASSSASGQDEVVCNRVQTVLDGIADACAQTNSIFLLRQPFQGNKLSEMVCKAARNQGDCPVVGLFHLGNFSRIDPTRPADPRDESSIKLIKEMEDRKPANKDHFPEPEVELFSTADGMTWGEKLLYSNFDSGRGWDLQRVSVRSSILNEGGATATSAKEVSNFIDVSCKLTRVERMGVEIMKRSGSKLPLLREVTHVVIFGDEPPDHPDGSHCPDFTQSSQAQVAFCEEFQKEYPVGIIAAGGTLPLLRSAIDCLKSGKPLFCFSGTRGSSDVIAKLIEFGKLKKQVESGAKADEDLQTFINHKLKAGVEHGWTSSMMPKAWKMGMVMAQNFPESFHEESSLLIDVSAQGAAISLTKYSDSAGASVDRLQDQITRVMASVYNSVPELGGMEADVTLILHANELHQNLVLAARRFWMESTVIVTILRAFFIATSVSAVLLATHQRQLRDSAPEYTAMALPVLVGLTASIYATYRPMNKFADLWAAAHAVEGELFRFRTRTHPYHAKKSTQSGRGHRQVFSASIDSILATYLTGDVRAGAARLMRKQAWGGSASCAHVADGNHAVLPSNIRFLSCNEYLMERAVQQLDHVQSRARWKSMQLKALQMLALLGAAVCVLFQRLIPVWTPVVLTGVATVEFYITYFQLDTHLPALNRTAFMITRALMWWDGLSLIQQRMPTNKDRFVDVVETALLMQHRGFVEAAIANISTGLSDVAQTSAATSSEATSVKPALKSVTQKQSAARTNEMFAV